jgi:hypothetical protein
MARAKSSIKRDSVLRGTQQPASVTQGVPADETPNRQTAVWLADEEIEWLDDRCQDIKRGGWRSITRSALIRSLIRAAMEKSPDLSGVSGEADVVERLVAE